MAYTAHKRRVHVYAVYRKAEVYDLPEMTHRAIAEHAMSEVSFDCHNRPDGSFEYADETVAVMVDEVDDDDNLVGDDCVEYFHQIAGELVPGPLNVQDRLTKAVELVGQIARMTETPAGQDGGDEDSRAALNRLIGQARTLLDDFKPTLSEDEKERKQMAAPLASKILMV